MVYPDSAWRYKLLGWGLAVEAPIVIALVTSAVLTGSAALVAIAARRGSSSLPPA